MTKSLQTPNKLKDEKSPYLRQHAYNPVNWYPWSEEVFEKAGKEDKPIFLSIGYSTCHWCHVMAEESFEDEAVADLLNKHYLAIKVDREERPDIDDIYMNVCQLMTGSAGWPLSIFVTPEKKPFYATTYIPKNNKYGRIGFINLLEKINELWQNKRDKIISIADDVIDHLKKGQQVDNNLSQEKIDNQKLWDKAYEQLKVQYDYKYGGFGNAPKFPISSQFLFLLNYWKKSQEKEALNMLENTLKFMRAGGIYDQLGFGFHRYATDNKWLLPHFEKMLYDQALLTDVYIKLYQETDKDLYKKVYKEIIEYCKRKMLSPENAFYTAEDADVEGEEGKYYLWETEEVSEILTEEENKKTKNIFHLNSKGNIQSNNEGVSEEFHNKNILFLSVNKLDVIHTKKYDDIRKKLLMYRINQKKSPEKDTKILTDWNGLMISSLASGYWTLKEQEYLDLAEKTAEFILDNLHEENRLLHSYIDNEASHRANLNDYSFFIKGLIDLYQVSFKIKYLKLAIKYTDEMIKEFWDKDNGGFYFTSEEIKNELIVRNKKMYDGSIPSGNSIALLNLVKLFYITEDLDYEKKSRKISQNYTNLQDTPLSYLQFITSWNYLNNPFYKIIIVGEKEDDRTQQMLNILKENYIPEKVIVLKPTESKRKKKEVLQVLPYLKEYEKIDDKTTIYMCRDFYCNPPFTEAKQLHEFINN